MRRVTVQLVEPLDKTELGLQAMVETSTGATRLRDALWELPLRLAVTVAAWVMVTVPTFAVKLAEVLLAATVTEAGSVSTELLSESATLAPPVGAACVRLTVHVVEAPEFTLVGLQLRAETLMGTTRLRVTVWEVPFRVAVTVAVWLVVMVPTVAVKEAEVLLPGTLTEAGTVRAELLSESVTLAPPLGAAWLRVTVQAVEDPEFTLVGLQVSAETAVGATKVRVAVWEAPFRVAVRVTLWLVVTVPAVAVKVVEVLLAATVTEVGSVSAELLSESATLVPPVGAAWLRVTVQVVEAPELTLVGLQVSAEIAVGATRLRVAVWEAPFRVAVTVALWLVVSVPAVAVKLAEVLLAATVTEAGSVSAELLSESVTLAPPVGAA